MKIKSNIIKGLGILLIVIAAFTSKAQQDPMYTQYMFNAQTINPAYTGTWESLSFMVLARQQWAGIENAPQTYTFSIQAPLKKERMALGLNIISDNVGLEKRLYLFGDYSYLVKVNKKNNLRLGLKGGFTSYTNNLLGYTISNPNDPAYTSGDINKKFMPNFGVGAFLYGKKYYVGFSVPKIIHNEAKLLDNNYSVKSEMRHYYLMAGLVFDLGENLKFKPTMLTKATFSSYSGAPVQLDLTANFLIKEKLWLGGMWRSGDAVGFIAQWIFNKKLRIGYAFDYSTSSLQNVNNGSHEVMVSYEIRFLKEKFVSPRYF